MTVATDSRADGSDAFVRDRVGHVLGQRVHVWSTTRHDSPLRPPIQTAIEGLSHGRQIFSDDNGIDHALGRRRQLTRAGAALWLDQIATCL